MKTEEFKGAGNNLNFDFTLPQPARKKYCIITKNEMKIEEEKLE